MPNPFCGKVPTIFSKIVSNFIWNKIDFCLTIVA